jgi:hypothetical protein
MVNHKLSLKYLLSHRCLIGQSQRALYSFHDLIVDFLALDLDAQYLVHADILYLR